MDSAHGYLEEKRLLEALAGGNSSTRLKAVLAIGTRPQPGFVDVLVARCAVEPDFFVRDMLTDALGDTDKTIRGHAALALGARGVTRAVPTLLGMVVEGPNDVEAAELLGTLARDPKWADRIMRALEDELAVHTADSAVRMRLTQALAEMPGTVALKVLRQLAHDDDPPVALIASTLVKMLQERPNDETKKRPAIS